ncbi:UDP-N-acetylmuramate dehydrogenase [Amphibiibacter pelophylacis]|uniref:UDP-N-acetylmuramate dehydrogenase n=1 Tax=Amphibiibacter pelophylacis TaxID=1799477 RepID=A0ACC6NYE6_9BURK
MTSPAPDLSVEHGVNLCGANTFGLPSTAATLVRIRSPQDVRRVVDHPVYGVARKLILGGGSNLLLTRNLDEVVLSIEIDGIRVVEDGPDATLIEAGAGVVWHDLVRWTLDHGHAGLENLALIPGTVGAAPVQNIGAYGLEVGERIATVHGVDLITGRAVEITRDQCRFGYRDSIFKRELAGKTVITHVRFRLPKPWQPVLGYQDLERRCQETGIAQPDARTIFDWVCDIRRAKLPDPAQIGNAGSFFKNPVVTAEQCRDITGRDPHLVFYPLDDGHCKLAAGWLIDACGWKGKSLGRAGVHPRQALVLVNLGGATGGEVLTLARAIQESVYGRFGIRLEPEPVVV